MVEDNCDHIGGLEGTVEQRRELAVKSLRHCSRDEQFGQLFPGVKKEIDEKISLDAENVQ